MIKKQKRKKKQKKNEKTQVGWVFSKNPGFFPTLSKRYMNFNINYKSSIISRDPPRNLLISYLDVLHDEKNRGNHSSFTS